MRLSVTWKVFALFAVLTVISVAIVLVILAGNRELSKSRADLASVQELQLQLKNLQLLQTNLVSGKENFDNDEVVEVFRRLHELAGQARFLTSRFGLDLSRMNDKMFGQLEYFRQSYVELIDLYQRDLFYPRATSELFRLLKLRVLGLPREFRAGITTQINDLLILVMDAHYFKDPQGIPRMRVIQASVASIIDDAELLNNLQRLVGSAEDNYLNGLAIKNRESFLEHSTNTFLKIADISIAQISRRIDDEQHRLFVTIITLTVLICIVILLSWLETARYFNKFLHALNTSVRSIRSGEYDFEVPEVDNDELGDQVHFVKEVAGQIRDNVARLTESEAKFRGLVENISDWIWAVDRSGVVSYTSPRCLAIVALHEEQLVGHSVLEFLDSRHQRDDKHFYTILKMKEPFSSFTHELGAENKRIPLETSGRPIYDSTGGFMGFQLISRDLTERQRVEKQLKKNATLQQLINNVLELALADLTVNETLHRFLQHLLECSWLGVERTGAIFLVDDSSQALHLAVHSGFDENLLKACAVLPMGMCLCGRAAQSGKVVFADRVDERHEIDFVGMHMHGHYCVPIHSVAGKVIGVCNLYLRQGTPRDTHIESVLVNVCTVLGAIIQRKKAELAVAVLNENLETQVRQRTAELSETNKELDSFAYSVSHDLRAPLRAIDGFSQALAEDYGAKLNDEARNYIARVRSGCERMAALINDILKYSRLTRADLEQKAVDVTAVAHEVIMELRHISPEREVECLVQEGLVTKADPAMFRAVMDNLIGNAWKYSARNAAARIEIGVQTGAEGDVFYVKDNGVGFDMLYKDKLFTAFQRLHSSEQFAGNGIGLATVKRVITRHGGKIWAESIEGEGATFFFQIAE